MHKFLFTKEQVIDDKFIIKFPIKCSERKQAYRAVEIGSNRLVLLTIFSKLDQSQFDKLNLLNHPNLVKYLSLGKVFHNGNYIPYLATEFVSGESLLSRIEREFYFTEFQAENIILSILNAFKFLHSQHISYFHFSTKNIMFALSGNTEIVKIKDLDNLQFLSSNNFKPNDNLREIGQIWLYLLTGELKDSVDKTDIPYIFSGKTRFLLEKLLSLNPSSHYQSVNEVITEIRTDFQYIEDTKSNTCLEKQAVHKHREQKLGFKAIAGMQELRQTIQTDIIDALNNKEKYAEYGLTIPNGMLLYGPPGCGKTFFAEKMAEEIGATFYSLKPSDIQSKWVNASQENVNNLFNEAKKNAPSIIFIDELDAILPSRDSDNMSHMNTAVVNEFLAQMNNCSENGIFVIGATNRPLAIDSAILRSGRLDKHIYLPPPDYDARKMMFELYLKDRPIDSSIDYEELSTLTENFVSSDIKFLCDEAARNSLKQNKKITQKILKEVISHSNSSLSLDELEEYNDIKNKFSDKKANIKPKKNKIGFF